jgi:hypothetical protein
MEKAMSDLRLVAGNVDAVARALIDGKPCSAELEELYVRVLTEHVDELANKHDPNAVLLLKR